MRAILYGTHREYVNNLLKFENQFRVVLFLKMTTAYNDARCLPDGKPVCRCLSNGEIKIQALNSPLANPDCLPRERSCQRTIYFVRVRGETRAR